MDEYAKIQPSVQLEIKNALEAYANKNLSVVSKIPDHGHTGVDSRQILASDIEGLTTAKAFPVGSIFMSVVTTNPATLLGYGTWSAWGTGQVPVGVDTGQTEFNTVEKTGGEKTHTLSTTEMPSHTHDIGIAFGSGSDVNPHAGSGSTTNSTHYSGSTGGDGAHNNLQPFITCYMWKRTA